MKPLIAISACALALTPSAVPAVPHTASARSSIVTARRRVYPALVNITVVTRYYEEGHAQRAAAGGSGVIVSPIGHVLTNFHVAGHTTRITCTLTTGEEVRADVVAHDPLTDLSVLKLRQKHVGGKPRSFPYAKLGDSDALSVGDSVAAMGNPLMLSSSVTLGIVSNTQRVFSNSADEQMRTMQLDTGEETGQLTRWIQHDALILPGNSGGPLVNMRGEVVGINELGGSGVGFAIPSNIARQVLTQVLRYGYIRRAWLGMTLLPVDKLGRSTGALVGGVLSGSPAAKAGLRAGDVVLAMNGRLLDVRFREQVPVANQQMARLAIGAPCHIRFLRYGRTMSVTATPTLMEKSLGDELEFREMGLTAQEITSEMALTHGLPHGAGVLITGMRAGYPFESAQPKPVVGDVITAVNGKPTRTLGAFAQAVAHPGASPVLISLWHDGERVLSVVKNDSAKSGEEGGELPRPWLGVSTQVVTPDIAQALHVPDAHGFRVTQVLPGTAAERAGLRTGDLLTTLNGDELTASRVQDAQDLKRAIENLNVGETAELGVIRDSKPVKIELALDAPPAGGDKAKTTTQSEFEFTVRELAPMDRVTNPRLRGQNGLLVTSVIPGGWAQVAGLRSGDLLMAVDGKPVRDAATFDRLMTHTVKSHQDVVHLFVRRGYETNFVFIEPDWPARALPHARAATKHKVPAHRQEHQKGRSH